MFDGSPVCLWTQNYSANQFSVELFVMKKCVNKCQEVRRERLKNYAVLISFFFVDWFSSPSRGKMRMMLTKFKNAPKDIISKLMAHAIILLTINGRPRSSKEARNCIPILCRNLASYTLNLYEENRNPIAALCDLVHPFPGRPEGT